MTRNFPRGRELKIEGKFLMARTMGIWMKVLVLFVVLNGIFLLCQYRYGFALGWVTVPIQDFAGAVTGFTLSPEGFELIIRLDAAGLVFACAQTFDQVLRVLLFAALGLVLLSPLKLGVFRHLWLGFQGENPSFGTVFQWYKRPALFVKSIALELMVGVGCYVLSLILVAPGSILSLMLYSGTLNIDTTSGLFDMVSLLAIGLNVLGGLIAFYLLCTLYPLYYCLAAQPDYSLGQVIQKGLLSTRGYRKEFFLFRLSFLPWYIFSRISFGTLELYVLPYLTLSTYLFLQAVAVDRQEQEGGSLSQTPGWEEEPQESEWEDQTSPPDWED